MKALKALRPFLRGAVSLPDILVSTAVTGALAAAMFTGITVVQRTGAAAAHYSKRQIEQARLTDYVSRDLRRALTVGVDDYAGCKRLTLTIPNYYDANGQPREPQINGTGSIRYGDGASPVTVVYYKQAEKLLRSVDAEITGLADYIEDFVPNFTDGGKQVIGLSASFMPRFTWGGKEVSGLRAGTVIYADTLLRNKRQ